MNQLMCHAACGWGACDGDPVGALAGAFWGAAFVFVGANSGASTGAALFGANPGASTGEFSSTSSDESAVGASAGELPLLVSSLIDFFTIINNHN